DLVAKTISRVLAWGPSARSASEQWIQQLFRRGAANAHWCPLGSARGKSSRRPDGAPMSASTTGPPASDFEVDATAEDVAFFRANGYLGIERITTDEELAWLGELYDEVFAERRGGFRGGYFDLSRPYDAAGEDLLPQVLFPERRNPELTRTTYVRNARRIAAALLGVEEARLQHWGHMILKPPRRGHETPWHQDEAYWEPDVSYTAVGAWMPLDEASVESGCLHFVPGSHLREVLPHRH